MAGDWTIRAATPADTDAIARVHRRAILVLGRSHYTEAEVASWAGNLDPNFYARVFARSLLFEVAVSAAGEVVAIGGARPGEVSLLYTDPDWVRQGIGSALLARAEAAIRAEGAELLRVESSLTAEGFYKRHGYTRQRIYGHRTRGGLVLAAVTMIKPA